VEIKTESVASSPTRAPAMYGLQVLGFMTPPRVMDRSSGE
jgi:hypothetical protein